VSPVALLAVKALAGGVGVVAFAVIGEAVRPKKFAGLFAAAPSVALASLLVTTLDKGPGQSVQASLGMAAGAAGMVAYCVLAVPAIARLGATLGSAAAMVGWAAVALALYAVFLR
jgi:hypothetical protein